MNTRVSPLAFALALLSSLPLSLSTAAAQGALTPPGAPAPTMKTLDQIEPRTPISALPFTISAAGSYYLTGNLTATADGNAITVAADNVTIDLNGFTLAGGATGSRTGIAVPATRKSLCVRNGTLTGWTASATAGSAIGGENVTGGLYENLRATGNSGSTALGVGTRANVHACVVTANACSGITAASNSFIGDCVATGNTNGIGILTNIACTISNCAASENSSHGIYTGTTCTIINCTANNNASGGIVAGAGTTVAHCSASGSVWGFQTGEEVTITDCTATANFTGFQMGFDCTVSRCTASKNNGSGIIVPTRCHVSGCTISSNNPSNAANTPGLQVTGTGNRIDGNEFANNGYAGFTAVSAGGNLLIRNTFSGAQYIITSGNTVGPTIDLSAGGGTIGAGANPWANIMY